MVNFLFGVVNFLFNWSTFFLVVNFFKWSIRVSAVESQWEASLQLFLVATKGGQLFFLCGQLTQASLWSILSSVAMIGKVGAESFLTFGQESKLDNLSFVRKIGLLAI